MLKKLIPLTLSLLICLSLLPGQAGAVEAPEDGQPVQAENLGGDAGSGVAPCMWHGPDIWAPGEGGDTSTFPTPGGPGGGSGSTGGH